MCLTKENAMTPASIALSDSNAVQEIFSRNGMLRPAGENPKPDNLVVLLAIFPDRKQGFNAIIDLAIHHEMAQSLRIDHSRLRFVVATSTDEVQTRDHFKGMRFGFVLHAEDLPGDYPELAGILPVH